MVLQYSRFLSTLSLRRATPVLLFPQIPVFDFYPRSPCGERPIIFCKLLDRSVISIHALLAESDALGAVTSPAVSRFLSTLSLRRATKQKRTILVMEDISIHALLAESDPLELMTVLIIYDFYPRSPCGERPERLFQIIRILGFLSTLSLRRATYQRQIDQKSSSISIHALLAESDDTLQITVTGIASISIHALLAESDGISLTHIIGFSEFLSTLSLRRATVSFA